MKRYLILAAIIAVLAMFLLQWRRQHQSVPNGPDSAAEAATVADSNHEDVKPAHDDGAGHSEAAPGKTNVMEDGDEKTLRAHPEGLRAYNEAQNGPVEFYGLMVDQDSNRLQNVMVDFEVLEQYLRPYFKVSEKITPFQTHTGADGRFQIIGLKGHAVTVTRFTKDGYEPELIQKHYGMFEARGTSFDNPAVFKMWSTNIHEQLIAGETSFVIIPDGRHYSIDVVKGSIAEGDDGDLVAWVKRPEKVEPHQKYSWSCELAVPNGGLLESQSQSMFTAPEAGYTNLFAYLQEANSNWWGVGTGDKRFYVRLRNGQMYGRIVINLYSDYHGKKPGMIQLSYALNPSGSRLLR